MTTEPPTTTQGCKRRSKAVSKKLESDDSDEEEEEDSYESEEQEEEQVMNSDESPEEDVKEEETGEMACNGGCIGKWSQYRFDELDWNQDPLAEDGVCHTYSSSSVYSSCLCVCTNIVSPTH